MSTKKYSKKKIPAKYSDFGRRMLEIYETDQYAHIARDLEWTVSAVGNYLIGKKAPHIEFLKRLSAKKGVSIHWLVEGVGPKLVIDLKRAEGKNVATDVEEIERKAIEDYEIRLQVAINRGDFSTRKDLRAKRTG